MVRGQFGMILLAALIGTTSVTPAQDKVKAEPKDYHSPYTVKFTISPIELLADLKDTERGDRRHESSIPFAEWSSRHVRQEYGSWGPPARHYPALPGFADKSLEWKRERVIAVALRYQGYGYQHHHIPDWDPPADWPWMTVRSGHNGKGVDCSNFTSFAYNQAFGIKLSGGIKEQAQERDIPGPGGQHRTRAERIDLPKSYADLVKKLKTGDLLFIRNKEGHVAHVVLWVGAIGQAPDKEPLILDSHGDGVKDCKDQSIPNGIHLRPFREKSWYFDSASHALRILHES